MIWNNKNLTSAEELSTMATDGGVPLLCGAGEREFVERPFAIWDALRT